MRRSTTSTRRRCQALDTLAAVDAVYEKAGANLNVENSKGDSTLRCAPPWRSSTRPAGERFADEAHDQIRAHRDRCRRVSAEYGTAQKDLNECLGAMGQLIRDTAGATHALSCGTTDRDSNEVR